MSARNAVSAVESPRLDPQFAESASLQQGAIIYPWKPSSVHLASAIQRAFSFRYQVIKRAIDVVVALSLMVLLFPVGLVLALIVRMSSKGPIFYCEQRVGRFRAPFRIIKFRTMYETEKPSKVLNISSGQRVRLEGNRFRKTGYDERITPIGCILRRTSLDELPQLWNVLVGDMSLVGPRPIVEAERLLYGPDLPYYDLFCPGITGLWQVSGRSDVEYERRVSFDREYASRWSCFLDFVILARTIPAVLSMRGAY